MLQKDRPSEDKAAHTLRKALHNRVHGTAKVETTVDKTYGKKFVAKMSCEHVLFI